MHKQSTECRTWANGVSIKYYVLDICLLLPKFNPSPTQTRVDPIPSFTVKILFVESITTEVKMRWSPFLGIPILLALLSFFLFNFPPLKSPTNHPPPVRFSISHLCSNPALANAIYTLLLIQLSSIFFVQRLFTAEELALYNGTGQHLPILLGILGY